MSRIRNFSLPVVALLASQFIPTNLSAQTLPTGIAGVVKDSSGAVIPGVTVEAVQRRADREGQNGGLRRAR